jgi:AAA domain/Bifunctional DNA primase/polymerase, N-terminal
MQDVIEHLYSLLGRAVLLPIPLGQKKPHLKAWQTITFEASQSVEYQQELSVCVARGGNIGVLLGPASADLHAIDIDDDELAGMFVADNPLLATTLRSHGCRGCQFWLRPLPGTQFPNTKAAYALKSAEGHRYGEWRCGGAAGAQSVIFGVHPEGNQYEIVIDHEPLEIDFIQIRWFARSPGDDQTNEETRTGDVNLEKRILAYLDRVDIAIEGEGGSNPTFRVACLLINGWALDGELALHYLRYYSQTRCRPPWTETQMAHKIADALRVVHLKPRGYLRQQGWDGNNKHQCRPEQAEPEEEKNWDQSLEAGGRTSLALCAMKIEPREPIFDDWCLVGDLGFIFAARGLGKTWLSMHLAHGAATMHDVGPWKVKKQLKVLYLDGEMPPQDIQARDRILGKPTENLVYINHQILFDETARIMNLANLEFQEAILRYCQTNKFDLLCLDNLSTLASGVDENKSIDWEILQPWLLRLRRSLVTVFFIHHAGRNNEMRGSSKREDPASWVMRLDQPTDIDEDAGAHFVSRFTKWRSLKRPETYEWNYKPSSFNQEIDITFKVVSPLGIFRSHIENGLDTCTMIAEEMSVTAGYVSRLATQARKQGWLETKGRKYVILE